jgi:hypothetical protein
LLQSFTQKSYGVDVAYFPSERPSISIDSEGA